MPPRSLAHWMRPAAILAGITLCSFPTFNTGMRPSLILAADPRPASQSTAAEDTPLLREGSLVVKRKALCSIVGERLQLRFEDPERTLLALENLAAQRIMQFLLQDDSDNRWLVDGTITVYRDRNFLLLNHITRDSH
ncbi:hypothetical protein Q31a_11410 [Aureliella helgolandensis]|uniref:Uncharacterized protein n=2 Tax=Aureliella helgolandensis TaxID=2527968 RepID=A0A518G2T2_9BACT|nr:hypothetical protein Q31a_11410 [Aureliella helgolandensis]